jgi:hypothetical protein
MKSGGEQEICRVTCRRRRAGCCWVLLGGAAHWLCWGGPSAERVDGWAGVGPDYPASGLFYAIMRVLCGSV